MLGTAGIRTIEYVPGYGLADTDGCAMYRIDETTGHAELLVTLAIVPPLTGGISPLAGMAAWGFFAKIRRRPKPVTASAQ